MKLLLDENLPIKLKNEFSNTHEVLTVKDEGWSGKKNGELLGLMTMNGFDGFLSIDKNLVHQQNLKKFKILIIVLNANNNKLSTLKPLVPKLEKVLSTKKRKSGLIEINMG